MGAPGRSFPSSSDAHTQSDQVCAFAGKLRPSPPGQELWSEFHCAPSPRGPKVSYLNMLCTLQLVRTARCPPFAPARCLSQSTPVQSYPSLSSFWPTTTTGPFSRQRFASFPSVPCVSLPTTAFLISYLSTHNRIVADPFPSLVSRFSIGPSIARSSLRTLTEYVVRRNAFDLASQLPTSSLQPAAPIESPGRSSRVRTAEPARACACVCISIPLSLLFVAFSLSLFLDTHPLSNLVRHVYAKHSPRPALVGSGNMPADCCASPTCRTHCSSLRP